MSKKFLFHDSMYYLIDNEIVQKKKDNKKPIDIEED